MSKGDIVLRPHGPRDAKLDRLADRIGFTSKNQMLGHVAHELSRCKAENYFKAVAALSEIANRK